MPLQQLPHPVQCMGTGVSAVPVNATDVASGSAANINLSSVSLQMSPTYLDAPLYLWPTQTNGAGHPVQAFAPNDSAVTNILKTWASL